MSNLKFYLLSVPVISVGVAAAFHYTVGANFWPALWGSVTGIFFMLLWLEAKSPEPREEDDEQ